MCEVGQSCSPVTELKALVSVRFIHTNVYSVQIGPSLFSLLVLLGLVAVTNLDLLQLKVN